MEPGGPAKTDAASLKLLFSMIWRNPYILLLASSAGIGGFLFGYDTGVISGALLYIRDDFKVVDRQTELQETIVSGAVAGAIIGAAVGGWVNDRFGRKYALMTADLLFLVGAILMASANGPALLIVGRIFVGFGVGMASMTAPLYISEASPTVIRGALVAANGVLITGGQFIAYLINLAFTKVPGTWRWMLGIAGIPAILQFVLMIFLPESPRWLYRKGRVEEAEAILRKVHEPQYVEQEIQDLKDSVDKEIMEDGKSGKINIMDLFRTKTVRRGLIAGVGLQVFQQFVGINTVMYYSPTIIQLAGFASNQTALLLSLITALLNAVMSIVSMAFIDNFGRKKLLICSLIGVILSLGLLTGVFNVSASHAPKVMPTDLRYRNATCPDYSLASNSGSWDCMTCLKAKSDCGFCAASSKLLPGVCVSATNAVKHLCNGDHREWFTRGCPSKYGGAAIVGLAAYIIFFAPGMGTVPWVVNSEIYPLRFRGICGGIAATSNWISNLIVAQTFLTLTKVLGTSWTFFMFGVISVVALFFVLVFVPETKGLPIEEVEKLLEDRPLHYKFWKKESVPGKSTDDTKPEP
ncbi:probable inositol transporter 2 [Mercurialis annua]|uniref:probable inositol transporter 2 n=1 Tax=Mercurialis annua TaxID=3986 RepID=UPI0021608E05|nr:probable inositol transporter 2 [Mercurialis annua]